MITYRDFTDAKELQEFKFGDVQIINIESLEYKDKPRYYYRVWFLVKR